MMTEQQSSTTRKSAVSLFSNCGAGDVGFRKAGFHFGVMAEIDARRLKVCGLNHPGAQLVPGDLRETWPTVVDKFRSNLATRELDLLAACPPCQGVSSARGNRGNGEDADSGMRDERNSLAQIIIQVASELRPKLIVVENVPAFLTRKIRHPRTLEPISAAKLLVSELQPGYLAFPIVVNLCEYGIPQTRDRTFLTFVRSDLAFAAKLQSKKLAPFPMPTYTKETNAPLTLRQALVQFALPPLDAKSQESASSLVGDGMHCVPVWDERRYAMIAAIPPNTGLSAWDNGTCPNCKLSNIVENVATCPDCGRTLLRPIVPEKDGTYRLIKGFRSSSYRRMKLNEPSATITTASGHIGSHNTIHPYENRVLSPLECAYLQTFPKNFDWGDALEKWGHTNVREMIGEAVPPLFTEMHGILLMKLLNGHWPRNLISADDVRCANAKKKLGLK